MMPKDKIPNLESHLSAISFQRSDYHPVTGRKCVMSVIIFTEKKSPCYGNGTGTGNVLSLDTPYVMHLTPFGRVTSIPYMACQVSWDAI